MHFNGVSFGHSSLLIWAFIFPIYGEISENETISTATAPESTQKPHPATSKPSTSSTFLDRFKYGYECGRRNLDGLDLGLTGESTNISREWARPGEFPWQAAIFSKTKGDNPEITYVCCGALVEQRFVITAASCVDDHNTSTILFVRLGILGANITDDRYPYQDIEVVQFQAHPEFSARFLYRDVAVLYLDKDARFLPHVSPICLPNVLDVNQFIDGICITTSWGVDAFNHDQLKNRLKSANSHILSDRQCQIWSRRTASRERYVFDQSDICVLYSINSSMCREDAGCPLVCYRGDGRYVLVGILSSRTETKYTTVCGYADVTYLSTWIYETMEDIYGDFKD